MGITVIEVAAQVIKGELAEPEFSQDHFLKLEDRLLHIHPFTIVKFFSDDDIELSDWEFALTPKKIENYFVMINRPAISERATKFQYKGNLAKYSINKVFRKISPNGFLLQLVIYEI